VSEKEVNKHLAPATAATSLDTAISLKSWFGNIIHSLTLDYNGTTVIQQTPFINMYNCFQLLTTFSYQDCLSQGPTIGFFPDDPDSWTYEPTMSPHGIGVCNNTNLVVDDVVAGKHFAARSGLGNVGVRERQLQYIHDPAGVIGETGNYTQLQQEQQATNLYRSYLFKKTDKSATTTGHFQHHIIATVYLKHIHSFFENVPLIKGAFMSLTLTLNNSSCEIKTYSGDHGTAANRNDMELVSSTNAVGGVLPFMITSTKGDNGGKSLIPADGAANTVEAIANISVGRTCLDNNIASFVSQVFGCLSIPNA
jgi:hypothetical protein